MKIVVSLTCIPALALAGAPGALAQSSAQSSQSQAEAVPPPAADNGIEDIIVTAQRRGENLQKVPISVTAVTAATAQALGVLTTQDVSVLTPGLHFQQAVGNATPFIRGIGTQAVGAGQESSVATYVDGVYIASQSGSIFALNNIERIEVLKGPQGTLFGRNATGGLIQIVTRDPSQTTRIEGGVGYGNFDTFEAKLYATTGLAPDLAMDVAAYYSHQGDGWGTNLTTGNDVNKTPRDLALRSKLLFTPGTGTRITVSGDYSDTHSSTGVAVRPFFGAVTSTGYAFKGDYWDVDTDRDPFRTSKAYGASLKIEQDLDFADLVSISAYRDTESHQGFDQDSSPTPAVNVTLNAREKQFSQELQLLSPGSSAIKWIVGAYYFRNNAKANPVDVVIYPVITRAPGLVNLRNFGAQKTSSVAAYAQMTVPIGDATNATGGIRYTEDSRRLSAYEQIVLGFAPSPPRIDFPSQKNKTGKPTWRLSLDHSFTDDVLAYASYNRGFKSGTFNLEVPTAPALRPERIDAFEVGLKAEAFDRKVRANVASFYYDYRDIQLTRTVAGVQQLLNAAGAEIYGVDVELTVVPVDRLTVRVGGELMHSRYSSFPSAVLVTPNRNPVTGAPTGGNTLGNLDARGNRTIRTPEQTFDLSADYHVPLGAGELGMNASYYYNGGWFPEADNRIKQKAYSLVAGQISWTAPGSHYRVRIWGRNLTNAKVAAQLSEQEGTDGGSVTAPRTYGIGLDFNF